MTRRSLSPPPDSAAAVVALRGITCLHEEPSRSATIETQVLFGETLRVHGRIGAWLDCSIGFAGYWHRGFVATEDAGEPATAPTHKVAVPWTPLRSAPRLKATTLECLSRSSLLVVVDETEDYFKVWPTGWVSRGHVVSVHHYEADPLAAMRSLAGIPFVWGGRSAFGLDCSGLVQFGCGLCGIGTPRASTDLADYFGRKLGKDEVAIPGDLIFYTDHCGVLLSETEILHSSGKNGLVLIEDREVLHERMVRKFGSQLLCKRRFIGEGG